MAAYDQSAMGAAAHASDGTLPPDSHVAQSIPELVRQLTSDTVNLVQTEIRLAQAKLRAAATDVAQDGVKIAVGAGFMAISGLALRWAKEEIEVVKEEAKRDDLPHASHREQVDRAYRKEQ